jgi:hypothetical protein
MRAIADRLDTYRLNVGGARVVWNILMIALLVWLMTRMATPAAAALFAGVVATGLTCGLAALPIARRSPQLASRLVNAAWWIAMGLVVVNLAGLSPAPLLTTMGLLFFAMVGLSASFWLCSTPGMLTPDGYNRLQRRAEHKENLRRIRAGGDDPDPTRAPGL